MKKEMKEKTLSIAAMLLALLLLGGCSARLTESPMEDISGLAITLDAGAPEEDAYAPREEAVVLYYLDEEGMTLVPVQQTIVLEAGMQRAEAALRALCAGPEESEGVYWPQIGALNAQRGFELSGGVATVNLPARMRALSPEMLYAVRVAITHTLTEFSEVSYVNVLIDGREEGFDLAASMPMGALSRAEDLDVSSRYLRLDEMRQSAQDAGVSRLTTLNFPSRDGRWILPEVRSVAYADLQPIEYLYTILEEIGKGSNNPLAMDVPAPMKYIEEMPEIVRAQDGASRAIEIRFSEAIDTALADCDLTRGMYIAMLTDTLLGFVPGMDGVTVKIGAEAVSEIGAEETPDGKMIALAKAMCTRADFAGYVGAPGKLYLPAREEEKLEAEDCMFPQDLQYNVRQRLGQLTQALENIGAIEDGLTEEDILACSVEGERVLLNLSADYALAFERMTVGQERLAVYAMVNTLTEGMNAERVAFFFEGEQRETLAGGLEMRGEFLRNPGMVVTKDDGSLDIF